MKVVDEIEHLIGKEGIDEVLFDDDEFIINKKNVIGESNGSVMCQKRPMAPAPSMCEASITSTGIPCKPERKKITL